MASSSALPPALTLTPPDGEALPAIGAPVGEDHRQTEYRAARRRWRALHPIREIKDFEEPE